MAEVVIDELGRGEIYLGTTRFPIKGNVRTSLVSQFPGKVVTGDYSKDSEQVSSNWIQNDWRGGILCEEMDEATQNDRVWWSTCNLDHKGHLFLQTLATSITDPSHTTPTVVNADMELTTGWAVVGKAGSGRSNAQAHGGTYSWLIINTSAGGNVYQRSYQDLTGYIPGIEYTFTCWIYCANGGFGAIGIDDGITETLSSTTTAASWTQKTVTATLAMNATRLRLVLYTLVSVAATRNFYFDDAVLSHTAITVGSTTTWANFNSHLYCNFGKCLAKLNESTGAAFTLVAYFDNTIVHLETTVNSVLLIYMGDTDNYYYMSTAEAITDTNVTDATLGATWSDTAWKVDADGNIWHAATPNSATPTWTANGVMDFLATGYVKSLAIYRDADGDLIIYAGTRVGLKAHDTTNAKFLDTELELPDHPNGGKGLVVWHDGIYISSGLSVKKYIAASTSTIQEIGLIRDDGLPAEYRGEIVKFIKGNDRFFGLIDSTQTTGTQTSSLVSYNDSGWQCAWLGDATEDVMYSGIVSSVYSYRLWFDHNDTVYYIPLSRDTTNVLKDSTWTYAASGVHITPWFDGGTSVYDKLAHKFKIFCKGTSANETVIVKYRIDHAYTDIATGWTTLGTIAAAGAGVETEYTFASDVGVTFKSIQFRFDLARGGTNTNTPDIQYYGLSYVKRQDALWGWSVTVDCSREHKGNSSAQLDAALKAIVTTGTKSTFTFRDESGGTYTYKVLVSGFTGAERTGEDWRNIYQLNLVQL